MSRLPSLSTGLYRAKRLALQGMAYHDWLTGREIYDNLCDIHEAGEQEQELPSGYERFEALKEEV